MTLTLREKYIGSFVSEHEYDHIQPLVSEAHRLLCNKTGAGAEMLGWKNLPEDYDKEEFARILAASEKIRKSCDVFLVLGIGGSYLGARAVIEFIKSPLYNRLPRENAPEIYFSGCNISATNMQELLTICEGKDVCINVISKSGTTTETAVAFRIFREMLVKKYGEEGARDRIFVTTDKEKGTLKEFATAKGYETFVVPNDVGGRFSVLTAVGLLPIAVAGIDIKAMMEGANAARLAYTDSDIRRNDCYKYAAIRNILYRKGRVTEILVGYEPYMTMMNEWWKQLFGESEGKDQKGIYPSSVIFSTDLHSLGQYIQDGLRNQFETVISVKDTGAKMPIPYDPANVDGLNFLSGMDLCEVNNTAMKGTLLAHIDGGVPNILIELQDRREFSLGYLIYFFELACAMSGYLLAVNPFDQPGVEAYKKNMFALLGKPGYEEMRDALEARLK